MESFDNVKNPKKSYGIFKVFNSGVGGENMDLNNINEAKALIQKIEKIKKEMELRMM